ncbi:MAG: hypothetical protein HOE79_02325 [Euryarchaeota archaeon]|nr:hypothetical protein [Euryarchaeota archaeon]
MLLTVALILVVSILPGFALVRILDPSSDNFRKILLIPALGLLLIFGLNGLLFTVKAWSVNSVLLSIIILNILSLMHIKSIDDEKLSQWRILESAMNDNLNSLSDKEIGDEVAAQKWFQVNRVTWKSIFAFTICISVLFIPIIQHLPFGVDWIGFSVLSSQLAQTESLNLSGTNIGYWTYPPAYPALSAFISSVLDIDTAVAVFELGHYSLFAIMLGLWGALDRNGAGAESIFALVLGMGLFAKTFDSGYPTVASQLGLVVGLLVLLRQTTEQVKHHTRAFILAVICVALIHPTGAIYLGLLMFSHIIIGLSGRESVGGHVRKILIASSILLLIAVAIALLIIAPRMLDSAVFAEYGWQGGRPLLFYNGILLMFGIVAAYRLHDRTEVRMLIIWISLLWLLTGIHLIEGFDKLAVLSLLSYTLYSMGIHAFHIPLTALVAIWLSPTTNLRSDGGGNRILTFGWDPHLNPKIVSSVIVAIMLAFSSGLIIMAEMSQHNELRPIGDSDLELRESLADLPKGSIVYSENSHWGHLWDVPSHIQMTSIPTLGLVELENSIQGEVTNAIKSDDIDTLNQLAITHAITSPRGIMQFILATSQYWSVMENIDSSKLWQFIPSGNQSQSEFISINSHHCASSCQQKTDTWMAQKFQDPISQKNNRIFVQEGVNSAFTIENEFTVNDVSGTIEDVSRTICFVIERVGNIDSATTTISSQAINGSQNTLQSGSGFTEDCFTIDVSNATIHLNYSITWSDSTSSQRWINPTGLSGRGDVIIDHSGLLLHWIELI